MEEYLKKLKEEREIERENIQFAIERKQIASLALYSAREYALSKNIELLEILINQNNNDNR